MRICYVNFAEHLQNAFNPNVLFDVPVNRWSRADRERFIDMVSAFRYNIFEFWLVPTLFSPEALKGGKIQREFAETINHVVAYGKRSDFFGRLPAGRRTTLQVPRQPQSRIEFPVGQRCQQRKHRRCQPATPQGTRAVEVLPRHGRAAACSFRGVVVKRNARVIHKPRQSRPVLLQTLQNPAARLAEFGIGKFLRRFGTH